MENNKEVKLQRLQRTDGTALSENAYNGIIGLTLLWGIGINVLMSLFLTPFILGIDFRILIVVYLIGSFGFSFMVYKSKSPALSFLGFTGLAVSMGLILVPFIAMYSAAAVYSAFLATGIVVVAMMLLSTIFPAFFLKMGRVLVFALLGAIIVELIFGLLLHFPLGYMDYIVVVIFAGLVGFDWAKAQMYPKTLDNAVDSAADIYVDIINIFIRILSIFGSSDSK